MQLHFPNGTRKYRASDSFLMRFNPFSAETAMTNTDEEHKLGTLPTSDSKRCGKIRNHYYSSKKPKFSNSGLCSFVQGKVMNRKVTAGGPITITNSSIT
jgi:hypothetical protein